MKIFVGWNFSVSNYPRWDIIRVAIALGGY